MEPLGQDMSATEYLQHAEPYLLGDFTNVTVVNKGAMALAAQDAAWIEFNFPSGSGAAGTGIVYILVRVGAEGLRPGLHRPLRDLRGRPPPLHGLRQLVPLRGALRVSGSNHPRSA